MTEAMQWIRAALQQLTGLCTACLACKSRIVASCRIVRHAPLSGQAADSYNKKSVHNSSIFSYFHSV
ncbi:hypothetical protein [Kerstersia gyiorum]|uniref:hypothetical protein n=1 Tax=Kerstersia gyiorum TaxID=206506 RepID=UPI0012906D75|nr:hypothetical protein [Kerstersia gyiorum]MCH4271568.1 hypothetical protein [Kerstersia gyiorum]MCI1229960.1 hypothetical protein [Kerstersia gyiorum]